MKPRTKRARPKMSLDAADRKALEKLGRTLVQNTKALRRRPSLARFQRVNAIIIQDPTDPGRVSICADIVIPRDDGSFVMWCLCFDPQGNATVSAGPCVGPLV